MASPKRAWLSISLARRSRSLPARSSINGRHSSTIFLRRRRRAHAGQTLAHHQRDGFLERRIRPVGDLVELAAVKTVVEHGREILRDARHAARPDRLDAGLLDRLEHGARLLPAGDELAMDQRVVAGELERDRVGMAAHDRGIRPR